MAIKTQKIEVIRDTFASGQKLPAGKIARVTSKDAKTLIDMGKAKEADAKAKPDIDAVVANEDHDDDDAPKSKPKKG